MLTKQSLAKRADIWSNELDPSIIRKWVRPISLTNSRISSSETWSFLAPLKTVLMISSAAYPSRQR